MKRELLLSASCLLLGVCGVAQAAMKEVPVTYQVNGKAFENVLVFDDQGPVNRPGLLMVPDWKGVTKDNVAKAVQLAGRDYVIMVADVYGKGVRPKDDAEAKAQVMSMYKDPVELRARVNAALVSLRKQSNVAFDNARIAALGYCFGGHTVLELARSGADIAAVASFHGGLDSPLPAKKGDIKASVLALNGAEDKGTEPEVKPFQDEMRAAGADWMFVNFAGAEHCFALKHANRDGCRYHPVAAARSERIMREFFAERFSPGARKAASAPGKTALVIHGGAGVMDKSRMSAADQKAIQAALNQALDAGNAVLTGGGSSLDAVQKAINVLEDSPLFNAGKGAVFNAEGKHELDASIMDGQTQKAGAIAGVTTVRNPINLARAVMERSQHVMLAGQGAEKFADGQKDIQRVPNSYFDTESRRKALQKAQDAERTSSVPVKGKYFGTVGAVALDSNGHIAAATSTGGMTNKRWGRVGDSPIIGAGTWADSNCGVSGTGWGEFYIRNAVAHDICKRVEYRGDSLAKAADFVINEEIPKAGGDGGIIALDRDGTIVMPFNTSGMYRGWINPDGTRGTAIFRD